MQPVRSADYPANPSLAALLTPSEDAVVEHASPDDADAAWVAYLGWSGPLVVLADPNRARRLVMDAAGVQPGQRVGIPANTRRFLSEAVKRAGGKPAFVELTDDLGSAPDSPGLSDLAIVWAQPIGGMAPPLPPPAATMFVDHGLTLPGRSIPGDRSTDGGEREARQASDAGPAARGRWRLLEQPMRGRGDRACPRGPNTGQREPGAMAIAGTTRPPARDARG